VVVVAVVAAAPVVVLEVADLAVVPVAPADAHLPALQQEVRQDLALERLAHMAADTMVVALRCPTPLVPGRLRDSSPHHCFSALAPLPSCPVFGFIQSTPTISTTQ
jgi:hypothetical protein